MSPYILSTARRTLSEYLGIPVSGMTRGELNYFITNLLLKTNPQSYDDFNALVGLLECIKLELYRRMVAPYEDRKRDENGEVY